MMFTKSGKPLQTYFIIACCILIDVMAYAKNFAETEGIRFYDYALIQS